MIFKLDEIGEHGIYRCFGELGEDVSEGRLSANRSSEGVERTRRERERERSERE